MKGLIRRNLELEQFVYIVSHNIRAPISTMLGLSGILESSINEKDKAFALSGLRKSIENLDVVIKDLNEVLLVKNSSENKSTVRFKEVLLTVEETLKGDIEKKEAKIVSDFKEADSIVSIRSFIYNIFYNLISNGIKYSKEGVSPRIDIWTEKEDDKIIIYISDNGKGIDMDKHGKQIFGLYKKFNLDVEGKGLGLFLVKTQVETMNGAISIESEIDKGTKFKIILPYIR
jgi:signal transduction histidine kinase